MIKIYKNKTKKGFVLLFSILLVSIILSITLGLSEISLKEATFSISGKSSNEAYFSADVGIECALYWDLGPNGSYFGVTSNTQQNPLSTICAGNAINISTSPVPNQWSFVLLGLGANQKGCATVTVDKTNGSNVIVTSKGYNLGGDALQACSLTPFVAGRVERRIDVVY